MVPFLQCCPAKVYISVYITFFQIIQLLLVAGASVNAKDEEERLPLHFAAEYVSTVLSFTHVRHRDAGSK